MGKPLSPDLRERVVVAVDGGMSRRRAAARFEVSAASAVRWVQRQNALGSVAPARQGGDRRSQRIEAHAAFILAAVEATPDVTLEELQAKLIEERGERFAVSTIWRFFDRRKITYKKRPRMRANNSARM